MTLSLTEYIKNATSCIRSEEERIAKYLYPKTKKKLKNIVNKEMLVSHAEEIFNKGKGYNFLLENAIIPVFFY